MGDNIGKIDVPREKKERIDMRVGIIDWPNVENTKWINFQPYTFENELISKPVRKKTLILKVWYIFNGNER